MSAASPWLRSKQWDTFWFMSGFWLLPIVAMHYVLPTIVQYMLVGAMLVLWLSHRFATAYMAFCSPSYQTLLQSQRLRFIVAPIAILVACQIFVFIPESALDLTIGQRAMVLATLFFLYNTYHFGVQHFGVLTIYKIRAGQKTNERVRNYERYYCIIVGGLFVALAQLGQGSSVIDDSMLSEARTDTILSVHSYFQFIVPLVIAAMTWQFFRYERDLPKSLPKRFYVISIMIQGIAAFWLEPAPFVVLWGVQHWLISVALTGHMAENDPLNGKSTGLWYRLFGIFNHRFWKVVLVLAVFSALFTPSLLAAANPDRNLELEQFAQLKAIFANTALLKVFVGLSFGTVFVHFVMDRAIFRFSNAEVRAVTGPLLFKK